MKQSRVGGGSRVTRRRFVQMSSAAAGALVWRGQAAALPGEPATAAGAHGWRDAGVVDTRKSPFAKLHPVPVRAVTIREGFWSKRRATNVAASMPTMYDELIAHGRMTNFERLIGKSPEPQKGKYYSDSDMYKWAEAVGWALESPGLAGAPEQTLPELRRRVEAAIREIVAIQEPSGYLNTYYHGRIAKTSACFRTTQATDTSCIVSATCCKARLRTTARPAIRRCWMPASRMVNDFLIPNYGPGPIRSRSFRDILRSRWR